ncbi:MAG: AAA family ATPase [Nanoarchaeota archaeon]|nr:AAA family ATPase [Nanoarchaeota archaeon]
MVKLKKLSVKGYRNIQENVFEIGDLTVLIGENNSGKSNILKAIDLFLNWNNSSDYIANQTGDVVGDFYELHTKFKDKRLFLHQSPGEIELIGEIELSEKEFKGLISGPIMELEGHPGLHIVDISRKFMIKRRITINKDNKVSLKTEYVGTTSNTLSQENIMFLNTLSNKVFAKLEGTFRVEDINKKLSSGSSPSKFSDKEKLKFVEDFLQIISNKILFIPAYRFIGEEPEVGNDAGTGGKNLVSNFLRLEKNKNLNGKPVVREINSKIKEIIPEISEVEALREDGNNSVDLYFDSFPSSHVGSGTNNITNNMFHITSQKDKIILFEEPETNIHAKLQRRLLNFLKGESENRQIVLTTHSPIFSNLNKSSKLYLIKKESGIINIKSVDSEGDLELVRQELGLENSDIFYNNTFLIVEGNSEKRAIPIILEKENQSLGSLGIKVVNMDGANNIPNLKILLKNVRDLGITPFILTDEDSCVKNQLEDLEREGLISSEEYYVLKEKEFEDCFKENEIISTCKKIYGDSFELSEEELSKQRKSGKKTSKIIRDYIHLTDNVLGPEMKVKLALELAKGIKIENEFYINLKKIIKIIIN